MYSAMTPCLSSRSRAGEGSSFLGALSFGSIIPIGARQMGTFDLCQAITSARNDRAVPPGRDRSALIILLVQIQPSAQPGRGPLGFAGTGFTGCGASSSEPASRGGT